MKIRYEKPEVKMIDFKDIKSCHHVCFEYGSQLFIMISKIDSVKTKEVYAFMGILDLFVKDDSFFDSPQMLIEETIKSFGIDISTFNVFLESEDYLNYVKTYIMNNR